MDPRQNNDIFNYIIYFIKNNNINDDLISVKNIYNHIKKNNISPNIVNPLDEDRNIFYSLFSIIYNKIKIYIHLLRNKKYNNDFPNFLSKNYINSTCISNNYIKTYDILYSPKCYVAIEYFIKTLSLCVSKLNIKDEKIFFFSGINLISSLFDLQMAEKENTPTKVDKNDKILNTEEFHLTVIRYIKNVFKYIYPHNAFKGINQANSTSTTNIASFKSGDNWSQLDRKLDSFFCLLNIIRNLVEFIINKNKKIKLKSLKLLYIIHKKIKNTYIIKKIFKCVSLNLFILYKSINMNKIKIIILKIFTISIDKVLKYYLFIEDNVISQYLKRYSYISYNTYELFQQNSFIKINDSILKQCVLSKGSLEKDNKNFGKKLISWNDQSSIQQKESTYFSNNIEYIEDKNVISNIYFICYYILFNYNYNEYKNDTNSGDDICEILNICKVIVKYYTILNRNILLMIFVFILSQIFYDKDINFLSNINFLFNNKILQYFEENNLEIHIIESLTNILKNNFDKSYKEKNLNQYMIDNETDEYISSNYIKNINHENKKKCFKNMHNSNNTINIDIKKEASLPIKLGSKFQNDLHTIFLNFIKILSEKKDKNQSYNEINNFLLDQLNYNIENYDFKYLYNIFLLKKENNIFIFYFLTGYIYYTFINYNLRIKNIINFSKHINSYVIFNFLLNLYEISDLSSIHNKNDQPFQTNIHNIVLNENNLFYSIDIYNNYPLLLVDNIQGLSNSFNFVNLLTLTNVKSCFKHQPISLVNKISIFSFLGVENSQIESYINHILFSEFELKNGKDNKNIEDKEMKQKCNNFHFLNYFLDFIIILLWIKTNLTNKDGKYVYNFYDKTDIYFEQKLETELIKNILIEYLNIFNNFFSLAVIIKLKNFKLNIQKIVENIICLCFEKIKENEIWKENKKNNSHYYFISLLIICINKSFLILYLTNLYEIIKKYFYKNLVLFLLNINNESNNIKQLSTYFLFITHKYLSNNEKEKYNNKKQNDYHNELIHIIDKYQDIITCYIYKKLINIGSINNCMKIFKLIKILISYNYSNIYIYKDICINIIKITKKKTNGFLFLKNKNKNSIVMNILNTFNYILYLFYKIIYQNRIKILSQKKYMYAIKDKILDGHVYININDLKNEINKKNNFNNLFEINVDNNLSDLSYEVDIPQQFLVEKNKKIILLYNFFFFKNITSFRKEKKNTFLNTVKTFYKNIKKHIYKNINYQQVANLIVDDNYYDIVDQINNTNFEKDTKKQKCQNNNLNHIEFTDQNTYSIILSTTSHIFYFAKKFFCHDDEHIRYNAQMCIFQCFFIFSTHRLELYPKINQVLEYIKVALSQNLKMNNLIILKILNYVTIIDDIFPIKLILKDIISTLCFKLKKFDIKNGLPNHSYEYRFLEKAMEIFLTLSRIEKCFDKICPSILFLCLNILNKLYDDKIKNISLNIISNLFITNIPKTKQVIESIRKIKERINFVYNENILTKKIINKIVFKKIINDIEVVDHLSFLSCLFMSEELKEIVFLIISIDYNLILFLIFYFELLIEKYKYKCSLNQHSLIVHNHFKNY